MPGIKRGFEWRLYRNTATGATAFASPTWNEVENASDIDAPLKRESIEMLLRKFRGAKTVVGGPSEWPIEFDLAYVPADADFVAFRDAYVNGTPIDVAVVDGDITASGTWGVRAVCEVIEFPINAKMKEGSIFKIKLEPSANADDPPAMINVP